MPRRNGIDVLHYLDVESILPPSTSEEDKLRAYALAEDLVDRLPEVTPATLEFVRREIWLFLAMRAECSWGKDLETIRSQPYGHARISMLAELKDRSSILKVLGEHTIEMAVAIDDFVNEAKRRRRAPQKEQV